MTMLTVQDQQKAKDRQTAEQDAKFELAKNARHEPLRLSQLASRSPRRRR